MHFSVTPAAREHIMANGGAITAVVEQRSTAFG